MANKIGEPQREHTVRKSAPPTSGDRNKTATRGKHDEERSIQTDRETTSRDRTEVARRNAGSAGVASGQYASPFSVMRRMAEDMERLFDDFGFGRSAVGLSQASWLPQIETFRRGDQFVVRADLPGLKKEDVKVEVGDGQLTISGERCEENEENEDGSYRTERRYGQFYRSLPLPEGVTGEQCAATVKDGVLEVTLKATKQPEQTAKQIHIR